MREKNVKIGSIMRMTAFVLAFLFAFQSVFLPFVKMRSVSANTDGAGDNETEIIEIPDDVMPTAIALFSDYINDGLGMELKAKLFDENDNEVKVYDVTYTWEKEDAAGEYVPVEGETGATLTIPEINEENYGKYRVSAEKEGTLIGTDTCVVPLPRTRVHFAYIDDAVITDGSVSVTANLLYDSDGSAVTEEGYTYRWYRHDGTGYVLSEETDGNTFTVSDADSDDCGTYKVAAVFGGAEVCSTSFVIKEEEKQAYAGAYFVNTVDNDVYPGDSFTLTAVLYGADDEPIEDTSAFAFAWSKDDGTGSYTVLEGETGLSYNVESAAASDFGYYRLSAGVAGVFICSASFNVKNAGSNVVASAEDVYAQIGEQAVMSVKLYDKETADLLPYENYFYKWYKVTDEGNVFLTSSTITDLAIEVTEADFGTYLIEVYDKDGVYKLSESQFEIINSAVPASLTLTPDKDSLAQGQSLTVSAKVLDGNGDEMTDLGTCFIYWYVRSGEYGTGEFELVDTYMFTQGEDGYSYSPKNAFDTYAGNTMKAVLTDTNESFELSATLFIGKKTEEQTLSYILLGEGYEMIEGKDVTVTAKFYDGNGEEIKAYDGYELVWYKGLAADGVQVYPLATDAFGSLTVKAVSEESAGIYTLTVIDSESGKVLASSSTLVSVVEFMLGDLNLDGKVGNTDLILMRRYISNKDKYPLSEKGLLAGDIKADGRINNVDLLRLRRYLADPIANPLKS